MLHLWRNWDGDYLYLYQGYWCPSMSIQGIISFQCHFQAHDTDLILITPPKSGTTWLKALAFAIANRTHYPLTESPLLTSNPHPLVPFLEFDIYLTNPFPNPENIHSPRIFSTHTPYALLPSSIKESTCRIVYLCSNPLDRLVSHWLFTNKLWPETVEAISLDQHVDMFCGGLTGYGPLWDHVMGYWKASKEKPKKVLFLQYEDMKVDIVSQLKTLAHFMGFPFPLEEERQGMIEEIASLCSFNNLKDLEVNKTGKLRTGHQNDIFFRKGEVGDWANYLTPAMAERMEKIMEEKMDGSGFTFKRFILLYFKKKNKGKFILSLPVQPDVIAPVAAKRNFTNHCNHNTRINNKKNSKGIAENKGRNRPYFTYCDKLGHTRTKCFKFHGFPPKQANAASTTSDDNLAPKDVKHELTTEQYQKLISLLNIHFAFQAFVNLIETATVNSKTGEEEGMRDEYQELIQTLPKESDWVGGYLYLYQGCWCLSMSFQGLIFFQRHFQAHDTDVIIITPPKSGTTWLKALAFAIANRMHHPLSQSLLLTSNPHDLVPCFEFDIYHENPFPNLENIHSPRIFSTHTPYALLPSSIKDSKCKIVYLCRNPLDTLVSYWHFIGKLRPETVEAISLDQLVDMFCRGLTAYGPFWDHVLGYWKATQEMPNKVLFLQYEDMKVEIVSHVKTLADFMGCPFSLDEEKQGMVEEIASFCSFDNLKDLEVNKTGKLHTGKQNNNILFRKGEVGDWANYLTPTMVERMEKLMEEKLEGSGFTFKRS
ncbi:hypothetical protein F0562_000119 [Nyssa sinensis]|uniref:Sulfotransferase domain-containing protein n=1 Tax=Nyssa sinensis TaxID=561372 RepID=A0A5J5BZ80_9ASTE|nr:hypothetical protein F0562_000119 [Nyssa sinensis]